jgi:hypothetical protein
MALFTRLHPGVPATRTGMCQGPMVKSYQRTRFSESPIKAVTFF